MSKRMQDVMYQAGRKNEVICHLEDSVNSCQKAAYAATELQEYRLNERLIRIKQRLVRLLQEVSGE